MAQFNSLLVTGNSRFINKINGDITGDAHTLDGKTITDTYSGTSTDAMSGKAVKSAIEALDVTISGASTSKTLTALSQADGKISATFGNISITKSQISDFPTIPTKISDLTNDSDFVEDANYVHTDNNYTTTEKNKLSGIATGAEVNQNAFSKVKVGSTTVEADTKTDTLELVGSNVTLTPDATNDKVTIGITSSNVTTALGYTPPTQDTTYTGTGLISVDSSTHVISTTATANTGDVVGPSSSTKNNFATYNSTDGKTIKDSGYTTSSGSTDTTATHLVLCNDTRLSDSRTPKSHTHGKIDNDGKITTTTQSSDVTIANNDKLVVADNSDGNRVVRTSVTFDGSTTTQCLTKKGTWANFTNNAGTITGITMNGSSKGTSGVVDLGTVITDKSDKMDKQDPVGSGTFTMNGSIVSPSSGSVCLGSNTNYIDGSTNSTIAGGSGNSIYNSGRSFIAGGGDNEISMGAVDVFMTGNSNSMIATSQSSVHGEGSHSATLGIGNRQCWDNSLIWGSYNSMSEPVAGGDLDSLSVLEIVGNGTSTSARSNARVLTRAGNEYLAGNLYSAGSLNGTDVNASGDGQFKNLKSNSKSLTPYTTAGVTNIATVTSGVSTSDFQCKIIGDLCMLSFGMSWTESVHSSIITGLTLKTAFRPYSQAICIALSDNGNGGSFGFGRLLINTSGQVRFTPVTQTAFANCHRCFVNITFVLATEYTVS